MTRPARLQLLWLALLFLSAPLPAAAAPDEASRTLLRNAVSAWDVGDRIRVTVAGSNGARMTGWYSGLESDSVLRFHEDRSAPPVPIPLHRIGALEESAGKKRHLLVGMGLGLVAGVLVGTAIKDSAARNPDAFLDLSDLYPAMGGLAGMIAGGTVGFFVRSERWREVASFHPGDD